MTKHIKSKWYRWPENSTNDRLPWFTTIRRAVVMPTLMVGLCLCWVSVFLGFGKEDADRFLRDVL
jgi:hypothetical protein